MEEAQAEENVDEHAVRNEEENENGVYMEVEKIVYMEEERDVSKGEENVVRKNEEHVKRIKKVHVENREVEQEHVEIRDEGHTQRKEEHVEMKEEEHVERSGKEHERREEEHTRGEEEHNKTREEEHNKTREEEHNKTREEEHNKTREEEYNKTREEEHKTREVEHNKTREEEHNKMREDEDIEMSVEKHVEMREDEDIEMSAEKHVEMREDEDIEMSAEKQKHVEMREEEDIEMREEERNERREKENVERMEEEQVERMEEKNVEIKEDEHVERREEEDVVSKEKNVIRRQEEIAETRKEEIDEMRGEKEIALRKVEENVSMDEEIVLRMEEEKESVVRKEDMIKAQENEEYNLLRVVQQVVVNEVAKVVDNEVAKVLVNEEAKVVANEVAKVVIKEEEMVLVKQEEKINEEGKVVVKEGKTDAGKVHENVLAKAYDKIFVKDEEKVLVKVEDKTVMKDKEERKEILKLKEEEKVVIKEEVIDLVNMNSDCDQAVKAQVPLLLPLLTSPLASLPRHIIVEQATEVASVQQTCSGCTKSTQDLENNHKIFSDALNLKDKEIAELKLVMNREKRKRTEAEGKLKRLAEFFIFVQGEFGKLVTSLVSLTGKNQIMKNILEVGPFQDEREAEEFLDMLKGLSRQFQDDFKNLSTAKDLLERANLMLKVKPVQTSVVNESKRTTPIIPGPQTSSSSVQPAMIGLDPLVAELVGAIPPFASTSQPGQLRRRRNPVFVNNESTRSLTSVNKKHGEDHSKRHWGHYCLCGVKASNKSNLTFHIRYFTLEGKFKCGICHKNFLHGSSLRSHMMQTHKIVDLATGTLTCSYCTQEFQTRKELSDHQRVCIHNFNVNIPTPIAAMTITNNSRTRPLPVPKLTPINISGFKKTYKCFRCTKSFETHVQLKEHYSQEHHINNQRPSNFSQRDRANFPNVSNIRQQGQRLPVARRGRSAPIPRIPPPPDPLNGGVGRFNAGGLMTSRIPSVSVRPFPAMSSGTDPLDDDVICID